MRGNVLNLLIVLFFIVLVVGIGAYFTVFLPFQKIKAQASVVSVSVKKVSAAFKSNDMDAVEIASKDLRAQYDILKTDSKSVVWLASIPLAGVYVKDYNHGIQAGDSSVSAMQLAIDAIAPYADVIGFKKKVGTAANQTTEGRLQTAIVTLDKITPKIDDIAKYIEDARQNLDTIDANRYPKKFGNTEVRSQIQGLKSSFDGVATLFVDSKPLLKQLPSILGSKKARKYLVLFENNGELRPTGGFLTAYAIFSIDAGRIQSELSTDIYNLDATISNHPVAPPEILKYHKGVSQFYIRDSNLSPDFVTSINLFNSLYKKSSVHQQVDGVFTIDTSVLVDILNVLGPTTAGGITFTTQPDSRCYGCAQVIYELSNQIDRPVNYIKSDRKGLLGQLLYEIMSKSLKSSPSKYWGNLLNVFISDLTTKHILAYMYAPGEQLALEQVNYAGRIQPFEGDYLHISDTNFAGAKSNLFVQEAVTSDSVFNTDGTVTRTVTIKYKNPHPASDCSLERGGLCLNAPLRDWLRVYVPEGSKLVSFQGSQTAVQTYKDLGKTVFEGFLIVNPLGTAQVNIKYTVPLKADQSSYKLLIQKQPGTDQNQYKVTLNGNNVQTFGLLSDKVVTFK